MDKAIPQHSLRMSCLCEESEMTIHCTHCHRTLRRTPVEVDGRPYGPTCARNLFGRGKKASKSEIRYRGHVVRDEATMELFA